MISIFPHETFASLLEAVAATKPDPTGGPVPHTVVVPSLQFSDHLQRCLADRAGICMGFDFVMPQSFVRRVVSHPAVGTDSDWSKRRLVWRILPFVPDFENSLGLETASPRDRFALAEQVADRFDQYGHFRPDMVRRWACGDRARSTTFPGDWQRALWLRLRETTDEPHPAELMGRLKSDEPFLRELARDYPRLHILGTGSLDPLLVEILGLLAAAGSDIHAHVILPTLAFLGDLQKRGGVPPAATAPEEIHAGAGHPLLPVMGRHAIGSFLLLGNLDENYDRWPVEPPPDHSCDATLLHRLQADIRALRAPQPTALAPDDSSIRVHACYGPRREMETVRDEILRALREVEGLQPGDIHIVNSSLEDYRPFISAVLQHGGRDSAAGLPVRMTEATLGDGNPVIEGLLAMLDLSAKGSFRASELIELLQLRAVQTALEVGDDSSEAEQLRAWIDSSGLTRGLRGCEVPGSWNHARDRLIAARWMDRDPSARYPDGAHILPLADDLEGGGALRSRFVAWHSRLEETLRTWNDPATPDQWSARLLSAGTALLGGNGETMLEVRPHLEFLAAVSCDEPLGADAVLDWFGGDTGGAGRRTSPWGGILCGRIKQLQNLPCRVLIMTGLQDGAFPARGAEPSWDLLRLDPRAWDRNPRVDDRQQFLDALLTPTDRLIITASTLNPRSLKESPFSSCVDELLRVLGDMGVPRGRIVVKHRLQPFAAGYFREDAQPPRSFDAVGAAVAAALRRPDRADGLPFWSGDPRPAESPEITEGLDADRLVRFWKEPCEEFVRSCDVRLPHPDADDEGLDRLPLEPDALQRWNLKDDVVSELLSGSPDLERLRAEATGRRLLPSGALGEKLWNKICTEAAILGRAVSADFGESIPVEAMAGAPAARVTARVRLTKDASHFLAWRTGDLKKPDQFLGPWIRAIVAAAAGRSLPTKIIMQDGTTAVKDPIPPADAALVLDDLVAGLRRGRQAPLAYSPLLSHESLKFVEKGASIPDALAAAAAKCGWIGEPAAYVKTDQPKPSSLLAWRDRDPFADTGAWRQWMDAIARPLASWGGF